MRRRTLLQTLAGGSLAGLITPREQKAQAQVARATRGMPSPKIKDVSVIATAPAGVRLTVVKITRDEDGLYGYGCGRFKQRAGVVDAAGERYLKRFVVGKPADCVDGDVRALVRSSC